MPARVFNFSAGPAVLPRIVLEHAQHDLVELPGIGVSPLEISHRSSWFEDVIREAEQNLRELLRIPETYHVLFLQGGASMQFSMVPINLLRRGGPAADYVLTGAWSEKAFAEARKEGDARVLWTGAEEGFRRTPADLEPDPETAYLHITSNETVQGVEWPPGSEPSHPLLVSDSSSDLLSRPLDVSRYGVLYAGAQKNAGTAGVTIAILRGDVLDRIPAGLASMLDYGTYVRHGSLHNTPPVFAIYVVLLVSRWLRDDVGGLAAQADRNRAKAAALYEAIDDSRGFYRGHADPGSRSLMNVTWRLPDADLEARFVKDAAAQGLIELAGHRSVGGIRASLYNAMPLEGAQTLAAFMRDFLRANR